MIGQKLSHCHIAAQCANELKAFLGLQGEKTNVRENPMKVIHSSTACHVIPYEGTIVERKKKALYQDKGCRIRISIEERRGGLTRKKEPTRPNRASVLERLTFLVRLAKKFVNN